MPAKPYLRTVNRKMQAGIYGEKIEPIAINSTLLNQRRLEYEMLVEQRMAA